MVPEIIDLTSGDEDNIALNPLRNAASRAEAAASRLHTRFSFLRPPTTPPKAEPVRPKKTTPSKSLSARREKHFNPSTPTHNSGTLLSSDDNIPLSLRKDTRSRTEISSINPALTSHAAGNISGLDSGLGESLSGSELSMQEQATASGNRQQAFGNPTGNDRTTHRFDVNSAFAQTSPRPLDQTPDPNIVRILSTTDDSWPPSHTVNKRKRSSEGPARPASLTSFPVAMSHTQKGPGCWSALHAEEFADHIHPRRTRSITPHIPGPKTQKIRLRSETSPRRPNSDTIIQERAQTNLDRPKERKPLSDIITRETVLKASSLNWRPPSEPERISGANDLSKAKGSDIGSYGRKSPVALLNNTESASPRNTEQQSFIQSKPQNASQTSNVVAREGTNSSRLSRTDSSVLKGLHEARGAYILDAPAVELHRHPNESAPPKETEPPSVYGNEGGLEMKFEPSVDTAFPPNFDRGRFPAQRRRRGGMKYRTSRINGFSKAPFQKESSAKSHGKEFRWRVTSNGKANDSSHWPYNGEYYGISPTRANLTTPYSGSTLASKGRTQDTFSTPERVNAQLPSPFRDVNNIDDTDSNIQCGSQIAANAMAQQNLELSPEEVFKFIQFFTSDLYPAIKKQSRIHQPRLSADEALEVEKSVANNLVNDGLVHFLRQNNFDTDRIQRKEIRKQISVFFLHKVSTAEQLHLGLVKSLDDVQSENPWMALVNKPLPLATSTLRNWQSYHDLRETPGSPALSRKTSAVHIAEQVDLNPVQYPFSDAVPGSIPHDSRIEKDWSNNEADQSGSVVPKGRRPINDVQDSWVEPELRQIASGSCMKPYYPVGRHSKCSSTPISTVPRRQGELAPSQLQTNAPTTLHQQHIGGSQLSDWGSFTKPSGAERRQGHTRAQPAFLSHRSTEDQTFRLIPLSGSRAVPKTHQDPWLERIIADAALKAPSNREYPRAETNLTITKDDQTKLLQQRYLPKTLVRSPDLGSDKGKTKIAVVGARVTDPALRPERQIPALLRHREKGSGAIVDVRNELRLRVAENLEPWRRWKGASSDIVTVAWAPDSSTFAIGAAAHTNAEDLQYNRPCNLLYGQLSSNKLWELPDHRNQRPRPETIGQGPNSIQETYNTCDPMIYQTVNSVAFSLDGTRMYTASRDESVKVWDTAKDHHMCLETLDHNAVVSGVDVSRSNLGVFATASQCIEKSVRVYYKTENGTVDPTPVTFSSSRAEARRGQKILPECVRWGTTAHTKQYLLAGFAQWENLGRDDLAREGQLCLWDVDACQSIKVTPSSQSVAAAVWHPFLPFFATGGAPGSGPLSKRRTTRTVVRTWDLRLTNRFAMEYESPALDMQDVTFHPLDANIVSAGCTDGTSFVWDIRWPDRPLHRLRHGRALMELDQNRSRAESDTGVCLSLWGPEGMLYYTGSSDGIVKAWDIRRHPVDVHIRDVAHVGAAIQNGAFSPDFSHMLVGDADGGIHILSSAPCASRLSDGSDDDRIVEEPITLIRAPDGSGKRLDSSDDNPGTEGIMAAKELVDSWQLEIHPDFGVGKGTNYIGPWSKDMRKEGKDGGIGRLRKRYDRQQVYDRKGKLNEAAAANRRAFAAMRRSVLDKADIQHKSSFKTAENAFASDSAISATACEGPLPAGHQISSFSRAQTADKAVKEIQKLVPREEAKRLTAGRDLSHPAAFGGLANAVREPGASKSIIPGIRDPWMDKSKGLLDPEDHHHSGEQHAAETGAFQQDRVPNLTRLDNDETPRDVLLAYGERSGSDVEAASSDSGMKMYRSTDNFGDQQRGVDNLIPRSEMGEEDFWWDRLGEGEIRRALEP